ncbi:2OG-Fe(II) oxygenase family protein [Ceratobasidium sp. AG-Ba]|nr:2OG-Fe(II) oxygenase family protein [Ceratobasidium sp. AG-Ba]QRW14228.1 2OG-Fe(II) oxygenase family protein [Ceratobasidium sp. AG-Ba]
MTKLKQKDGPRVVVDLDDIVVMWYLPDLIGTGLQTELLQATRKMSDGYLPPLDKEVKDRRAQQPTIPKDNPTGRSGNGPLTRSRTSLADAPHMNPALEKPSQGSNGVDQSEEGEDLSEDPAIAPYPAQELGIPTRYVETDDEVRWTGGNTADEEPQEHSLKISQSPLLNGLAEPLSTVPSLAYYFSPGWFQTGMQYIRPIAMSSHFRDALAPHCGCQTVAFLEAKRLFDGQLSYLTNIIYFKLAEIMQNVHACMLNMVGPTGVAVQNGWTSPFPCYGVAVNCTSLLHCNGKGIQAGIDIIGVLGTFTEGGDLCLPDIKLKLEWGPGSVGAFNGYDLQHYVKPWKGVARVALISFCHCSTWSGLGLDCSLRRPTLSEIHLPVPLNHINGTLRDLGRVFDGSLLGPDYRMQAGEPKESNSR